MSRWLEAARRAAPAMAEPADGGTVLSVLSVSSERETPEARAPSRSDEDRFPDGTSAAGRPLTWTGRVVSLDDWRRLSDWDRHGFTGRVWNGIAGRWDEKTTT